MQEQREDDYEEVMMTEEDMQAICNALCKTLQLTMAGNNLISIEYKVHGPWSLRAILHFMGGSSQEVNVSMDGGIRRRNPNDSGHPEKHVTTRKGDFTTMLVQMTDEKLERQNRAFKKLIGLMQAHPNLPVVPMVDAEVVQDDICGSWSASFGGDPYISKIRVNKDTERLVFWDDRTDISDTFEGCGFDYDECGIMDDMTDEESDRIMEQKISELNWLLCIIAPIGIPEPFIPGNVPEYRKPTNSELFENLRKRVQKYREATERA